MLIMRENKRTGKQRVMKGTRALLAKAQSAEPLALTLIDFDYRPPLLLGWARFETKFNWYYLRAPNGWELADWLQQHVTSLGKIIDATPEELRGTMLTYLTRKVIARRKRRQRYLTSTQ